MYSYKYYKYKKFITFYNLSLIETYGSTNYCGAVFHCTIFQFIVDMSYRIVIYDKIYNCFGLSTFLSNFKRCDIEMSYNEKEIKIQNIDYAIAFKNLHISLRERLYYNNQK